jgi:hypothetical protein
MAACLRHRGPDDEGFLVADEVGLAHTRLSIIDLEGGHQPIRNEDGTVWVVFNGEIFNYKELQPALSQAGHSFYTRSDTEVIVHAYEQHGLDFTRHLNGQFAIALWDARRKRLVLARDRVGIRPLFYRREGGRFLFASEVKALLALPGARRALDLRGLGQALTLWAPLAPRTMFEGIFCLPPGHVMVLEGGRETVSRYWDWSLDPDAQDDYASLDRLAEELRAAGVADALLSFGESSVVALGAPEEGGRWRLLVRGPGGEMAGVLALRDQALSVSASLGQAEEIAGRRFGHVLDPRTGRPLEVARVAVALAPTAGAAEAWSKAVLVLGAERGLALAEAEPGVEALLLEAGGRSSATSGFAGRAGFEALGPGEGAPRR